MIAFDEVTKDAQELPVVSWVEDRNLFGGGSRKRIACFIAPDSEGVLQFCCGGQKRPWAALKSFALSTAEREYYDQNERMAMEYLRGKSKIGGPIAHDNAHVIVAQFADERASVPMPLNRAIAKPLEIAELHNRLRVAFIAGRGQIAAKRWQGDFTAFAVSRAQPAWVDWAANVVAACVLGLMGFGFYWLVVR